MPTLAQKLSQLRQYLVDVSNQDVKKFVLRITLDGAGAQKTA